MHRHPGGVRPGMEASVLSVGVLLLCVCVAGGQLPAWRSGPQSPSFCSRRCAAEPESGSGAPPPLYQCSCSRGCSVFGDCCYDSPYRNAGSFKASEVICLSVSGHGQYKAVSSCHSSWLSNLCKNGLGKLPPVTSRVTNVTYLNNFCAICNEDGENLVPWNVELRCSNDANFAGDGYETTRYVYHYNDIYTVNEKDGSTYSCKYHTLSNDSPFMDGLELRRCSNIQKVSRCAATWENVDVLRMCESYEDPVFFGETAYRNAHCAECNYMNSRSADCLPLRVKVGLLAGSEAPDVADFCRDRGGCRAFRSVTAKGQPYLFSGVFNPQGGSGDCTPQPGRQCCDGEVFSYGRCRKVLQR